MAQLPRASCPALQRLQDVDLTIINYLAELYGNFDRHEDLLRLIQNQEEATGLPLELQVNASHCSVWASSLT